MAYKRIEGEYISHGLRAGTVYGYQIQIPDCPEKTECAVLIHHDELIVEEAEIMDKLYEEGVVPPCVIFGIHTGKMSSVSGIGQTRNMRCNDYDVFSSGYMDFIVDEFIPEMVKRHGLCLSDDPNMHMTSGGSSGGISAWNGVWFRNDYFRRTYINSPTFSAMCRGYMAPVFMRLFETKPIRAFISGTETEPDQYFGSSYCAALEGHFALRYAGYDYTWEYYPGEEHCSRVHDGKTSEEVMRFIWKDWETVPVTAPRNTEVVEELVWQDKPWELTEEPFPVKAAAASSWGTYRAEERKVFFKAADSDETEKMVETGLENVSAVAVSSDLWRLYLADPSRGCIYAATICEDGELLGMKMWSSPHMATDFCYPGATDICVDCNDRIFAATELGVQCIRSFGIVDAILPLPGNAVPKRLAFGGENMDYLYADCGDRIFCRKMKTAASNVWLEESEPKFTGYYGK